jgi:putative ABC transport system substrate-binding protein
MKRILFPLVILLTLSAILILPDLKEWGRSRSHKAVTRIAVFRFNSNQLQQETENGLLERLKSSKAYTGGRMEIRRFCAEGDMPTANMIARNIVNEKFDMVVTISTPGLQVMANTNKEGKVMHIFCAVTDPVVSGVGITGQEAGQHPEHLVGIGTFQPVESIIRVARQMNPRLSRLGVVWCTSETCSEACVKKARIICKELGIELLEMGVESVTQVYETALSLCERGVEALWIGGDNVVESAIEMYVEAGMKYRIPVFTNNPKHALKGAMANLGADYYQVGVSAGDMVISLIKGFPAKKIEIKNVVPEQLFINDSVRSLMKSEWAFPDELKERCDSVISVLSK